MLGNNSLGEENTRQKKRRECLKTDKRIDIIEIRRLVLKNIKFLGPNTYNNMLINMVK